MVAYIRSDLDFILAQIKIAEAHAAGQPLYGSGRPDPRPIIWHGACARSMAPTTTCFPARSSGVPPDSEFPELLDPISGPPMARRWSGRPGAGACDADGAEL